MEKAVAVRIVDVIEYDNKSQIIVSIGCTEEELKVVTVLLGRGNSVILKESGNACK